MTNTETDISWVLLKEEEKKKVLIVASYCSQLWA